MTHREIRRRADERIKDIFSKSDEEYYTLLYENYEKIERFMESKYKQSEPNAMRELDRFWKEKEGIKELEEHANLGKKTIDLGDVTVGEAILFLEERGYKVTEDKVPSLQLDMSMNDAEEFLKKRGFKIVGKGEFGSVKEDYDSLPSLSDVGKCSDCSFFEKLPPLAPSSYERKELFRVGPTEMPLKIDPQEMKTEDHYLLCMNCDEDFLAGHKEQKYCANCVKEIDVLGGVGKEKKDEDAFIKRRPESILGRKKERSVKFSYREMKSLETAESQIMVLKADQELIRTRLFSVEVRLCALESVRRYQGMLR